MIYNRLNNKKRDGEKMTKKETKTEKMKNVSFPIYKDTRDRYLDFKKENNLTHDEALNQLLDTHEREVKENERE